MQIDYKGFRIVATCVLPLGPNTLCYGTPAITSPLCVGVGDWPTCFSWTNRFERRGEDGAGQRSGIQRDHGKGGQIAQPQEAHRRKTPYSHHRPWRHRRCPYLTIFSRFIIKAFFIFLQLCYFVLVDDVTLLFCPVKATWERMAGTTCWTTRGSCRRRHRLPAARRRPAIVRCSSKCCGPRSSNNIGRLCPRTRSRVRPLIII